MKDPKKIVILGAGGHGVASILPYLMSLENTEVKIHYVPADAGGSTGTITKTFEYNEGRLNLQLHGNSDNPILPFGDLNKLIMGRLKVLGYQHASEINLRSDEFGAIKQAAARLVGELGGVYLGEFLEYVSEYLSYYNKIKSQEIPFTAKETCLGNIWHTFLHYRTGSLIGINRFYWEQGILPRNMQVDFTFHERQTLVGQSIKDELFLGEDIIDDALSRVLPYTLKIHEKGGNRSFAPVSETLIAQLLEADLIILPNGSIANWLGLINSSGRIRGILKRKGEKGSVILMANLFYGGNEFPLDAYLELLCDNYSIPLDILTTNQSAWDDVIAKANGVLDEYREQGKIPNHLNGAVYSMLSRSNHFSRQSELKLAFGGKIEGIKYDTDSVSSLLHSLYPTIN